MRHRHGTGRIRKFEFERGLGGAAAGGGYRPGTKIQPDGLRRWVLCLSVYLLIFCAHRWVVLQRVSSVSLLVAMQGGRV